MLSDAELKEIQERAEAHAKYEFVAFDEQVRRATASADDVPDLLDEVERLRRVVEVQLQGRILDTERRLREMRGYEAKVWEAYERRFAAHDAVCEELRREVARLRGPKTP